MNIPIEEIIAFHIKRTNCHVQTMNYFAELLGYQFPEHDSDKYKEPYQTGYAYYNYAKHHKNCVLLPQQFEAFKTAHDEHHRMQPHHVRHYTSMKEIPNIFLIEMVCDWHSANFEQNCITCENEFASVSTFFQESMSNLDWTPQQLKMIHEYIDTISNIANYDAVKQIWQTLQK